MSLIVNILYYRRYDTRFYKSRENGRRIFRKDIVVIMAVKRLSAVIKQSKLP